MDWLERIARLGGNEVTLVDHRLRADGASIALPPVSDDGDALLEAAASFARDLAGAPRLRDRTPTVRAWLLRPEGWWGRVLVGAGLSPSGEGRWEAGSAVLTLGRSGVLEFAPLSWGWATPYAYGPVDFAVAWLPIGDLPDAEARAIVALRGLLRCVDAATWSAEPPRTEPVCRFCGETFPPEAFHAHLGACHGCAERELGVVH